ncbi:hypothetical protein [Methylophilus sp.]|uniref:AbrB/MazE/SpoVT family DNA-binding domain-containing protein n=1 Tax=Methylophilus sp. TaxID=29541 RepID=UPI00257ACE9D|nr:hypothetical protein [Methylophilus sp.]
MTQNQFEEILVRFEADTLSSVGPCTVHRLVDFMESDSLESLIHLLLRNLAAETGLLPTSPRIAYPLQARFLPKKEYILEELMAGVTEENKHECIDFGKPVGIEKL